MQVLNSQEIWQKGFWCAPILKKNKFISTSQSTWYKFILTATHTDMVHMHTHTSSFGYHTAHTWNQPKFTAAEPMTEKIPQRMHQSTH